MFNFKNFEKNPQSIIDYYREAIRNPKEFCKSINFNEDLADSGLVILVFLLIQVVIMGLVRGGASLMVVIGGTVGLAVGLTLGLAIATVFVFVIGKVSKAKTGFLQSFNIVAHSWFLTFPLSVVGYLFSFGFLLSSIIQLVFFLFVMIKIFEAVAARVYVITGVLFCLAFIPMACMMMGKALIESNPQMQEVLQGRSLEEFAEDMEAANGDYNQAIHDVKDVKMDGQDLGEAMENLKKMQEGMEKSQKLLPPCYKSLAKDENNKNPIFNMIGLQVSFLGAAPPEERKKAIEKLHQQIDKSIEMSSQAFPMSAEQKSCLSKVKANLKNFN